MTTILTDGLVLVSDSLVHSDGAIDHSVVTKTLMTDERAYALAGESSMFVPMVKWYEAGANPRQLPAVTPPYRPNVALWVFEGGKLFEIHWETPHKLEIGVPNVLGTGRKWAMGALLAGASPVEAVKIAMRCDIYSGGEVRIIELLPHLQIASALPVAARGRARGGLARAESLSPERRSEIARGAADKRWRA